MPFDNSGLIEHLKRDVLKNRELEKALKGTPRELFVPEGHLEEAYGDYPLPIGHGQTISQPWTVVFMTEWLDVKPGHRVLEIGAGSGWQAALLGKLVGTKGKVFTVEINEWLAELARRNLERAGVNNVEVLKGDGALGIEDGAPFDRILVTAAAPEIPPPLLEQLKEGGKLVAPVGRLSQVMVLYEKTKKGLVKKKSRGYFRFVPLVGRHGFGTFW